MQEELKATNHLQQWFSTPRSFEYKGFLNIFVSSKDCDPYKCKSLISIGCGNWINTFRLELKSVYIEVNFTTEHAFMVNKPKQIIVSLRNALNELLLEHLVAKVPPTYLLCNDI